MTVSAIAPDYFKTLGVDFLAGRDLVWADGSGGPPRVAIVVNQALAQQTFGTANAIDQRVVIAPDCRTAGTARIRQPARGWRRPRCPERQPHAARCRRSTGRSRSPGQPTTLLVRTSADPATMIATVRRAVTEINADIPTFSEAPLATLQRARAASRTSAVHAARALRDGHGLGERLGIYGLLAYDVTRRRAEIGIRMAVGADARAVDPRSSTRDSLAAVAAGLAAGLAAAVAAHWALRSMFYGVSLGEPIVLISAAGVFLLFAAAAAALPARSAVRVDPVQSLRL